MKEDVTKAYWERFYASSGKVMPSPKPIPPQKWPKVLLPLKLLAVPEDCGLGDIIARTIGPIGGEAFKEWYKAIFGRPCGCDVRQEAWNQRYPL